MRPRHKSDMSCPVQVDAVRRHLSEAVNKFRFAYAPASGGDGQNADCLRQAATQTRKAGCSSKRGVPYGIVVMPDACFVNLACPQLHGSTGI
jgi:hypothetical protein